MVLHTGLWLLFTILAANISTGVAQEIIICGSGPDQDLCINIEEYIRQQVQESAATKLVTIDQSKLNIDNDIKNTANKIILQVYQDINQIINKINMAFVETILLDSLEKVNDQLTALNNSDNLIKQDIQKLFNITEGQQKCEPEKCQETCGLFDVPNSIKPSNAIWKDRETPEMDDLDTYMNMTKGCQYEPLRFYYEAYFFPERRFDGTPIEAHFAVRTHENAHITVWWEPRTLADYVIDVGVENHSVTKLIDRKNSSITLSTQPTPKILSEDRYEQFFIKIDKDTLTFGKKCESPIITHKISIARRDSVHMSIEAYSVFGGKILHDCTADA